MAIGGEKREIKQQNDQQANETNFEKKVGLFEASVIAVNPTVEEYFDLFGIELKENSKSAQYLGVSKGGNPSIRVEFWLQEVKTKHRFRLNFYLEDQKVINKDRTKNQYINNIGVTSWAADEKSLPDFFSARNPRLAKNGEEEFYTFLRTWLGNLDYRNEATVLDIEWDKLMKGNVKDLKAQVNGAYATNVVALATISTKISESGEILEYQNVYNKAFLYPYLLKQFRLVDYDNTELQQSLHSKNIKDLKSHEKFVVKVTGNYRPCKDFFSFKELHKYDSKNNIVASDKVIAADDDKY